MNASISVRFLQKGEDTLWRKCRFSTTPLEKADESPFTAQPTFRSETHLVAKQEGRVVGKMEYILNEPHIAVLVDPIVVPDAPIKKVAYSLLSKGIQVARSLNVRRILVILQESLPYLQELLLLMPTWGFRPLWQKNKYTLNPKDLPPLSDLPAWMELEFVPFKGLDDQVFLQTLNVTLQETLSREDEGENAVAMVEMFIEMCRKDGNYFPEDWEIALVKSEPVGVVLPAFLDPNRDNAGNLFIGVIPKARGQGLGKLLHYRGLQTIGKRGVRKYLSSTDSSNMPMIKIFESLNYQLVGIQHYFEPTE
jgi:ribosomal protein S18 acetylase RimI-like enzyme